MEKNGCFTTLVSQNCAFRLERKFCIFFVLKVSEMLWNTPKHYFGSNGVEWMVHNFGTPKQCIKARTQVLHVLRAEDHEMLWNTLKHHFGPNGVEWMLHNFGTSKQCIKFRNISFASFYLSKVSEMIRNTPKHHFGSNGVEWMLHNFCTSKQCIPSETQVLHLFTRRRLVKWSETLPNIILGPME
jgi:hypothetical protein